MINQALLTEQDPKFDICLKCVIYHMIYFQSFCERPTYTSAHVTESLSLKDITITYHEEI
jgi:hypothetical protein